MCAPGGEDGLLRMVGFMVNRNLYPFQLLRAVPFIEPSLREQFPALAALQSPKEHTLRSWRANDLLYRQVATGPNGAVAGGPRRGGCVRRLGGP
jgi:hypothetical protein